MRGSRVNPFVGILVAGSMLVSSTGAVAATSTSALPQVNPWAALTAMSGGAPAAALCGGAAAVAAAAQAPASGCVLPQADAPPVQTQAGPPTPVPVPPVDAPAGGLGIDPLILGLGALAAGALVYFLVIKKDKDDDESPA